MLNLASHPRPSASKPLCNHYSAKPGHIPDNLGFLQVNLKSAQTSDCHFIPLLTVLYIKPFI